MKFLRPRFSIFTMLVLIGLVGAGMAAWQQWVMWPALQDHLQEMLLVAAPKSEIVDQVERLVRRNPALVKEHGLMKWAVEHGSIKFCEDLLDAGLDPNEPVSFAPPMIWAVLARRPEIVTLLIDRGADPNQLNQIQYQSPLDVAASLGDMPMCILLVEHGADVNHVDIQGLVTLHQGVQSGNYELVEYLLRCGAIPPDSYNVPTPLEYAIMMRNRMRRNSQRWNRQEEIVRILAVRFADEADTLEKEGVL